MTRPLFDTRAVYFTSLAAQCPVVADAVVSKALWRAGNTRQTLFAMDTGQELSEHSAPFAATIHVLDGRLEVRVAEDTHEMRRDDWLMMPAGAPHGLVARAPTRFLLTLVTEDGPNE